MYVYDSTPITLQATQVLISPQLIWLQTACTLKFNTGYRKVIACLYGHVIEVYPTYTTVEQPNPKMASAIPIAGCWLLLQVSWIVAQQTCPVVNSIFPPSGTVRTMFLLSGNNLDRLTEISINIGVDRMIPVSNATTTHYNFTIGGTMLSPDGLHTLMFTAMNQTCVVESLQLDLRSGT